MDPEFPQVLSCGIPGRVVAGLGVLSRLGYAGLYVGSIGFDGLPKEGLSLHLCNVVIPVRLPLWGQPFQHRDLLCNNISHQCIFFTLVRGSSGLNSS